MAFCKTEVNMTLLPLKAHYFIYLAAMASVMPYQAAVGRRGGIPEATIAYILGFIPLLAILAKPVCGFVVDKTQNVKLVLIGLNALGFVSNGVIFLNHGTPFEGPNVKGRLTCPEGNLTLETESFNCMASLLECNVSCRQDKSIAASIKTEPLLTLTDAYSVCNSLWNGTTSRDEDICEVNCPCHTGSDASPNRGLYAVFLSLAAVAMTALVISDAAICEILGENSYTFGQQRLWGTIGFGVCSPVVGVFIDKLNEATDGRSGYSPCFYVFGALLVTDIILLFFIPPLRMSKVSSNFFKDIATVLSRLEMTVFALWTCLLGALLGITVSYNTWFLEDIGASKMIVGLNGALMAVLIELPLLFVSGFILEQIGYFPCYCLAFVALATKYVGYSYLYEPWFSLLIEIVGGAAFPLTIASMTVFAKVTAPGGTAASVLCILNCTFDGIGVAIGNVVGGACFAFYGGRLTFRYLGVVAFGCAALCLVSHLALGRRGRKDYAVEKQKENVVNVYEMILQQGQAQKECLIEDVLQDRREISIKPHVITAVA